jgi:hypothetical protein
MPGLRNGPECVALGSKHTKEILDKSVCYPLNLGMAEPHTISALKTKRDELCRTIKIYEGRLRVP